MVFRSSSPGPAIPTILPWSGGFVKGKGTIGAIGRLPLTIMGGSAVSATQRKHRIGPSWDEAGAFLIGRHFRRGSEQSEGFSGYLPSKNRRLQGKQTGSEKTDYPPMQRRFPLRRTAENQRRHVPHPVRLRRLGNRRSRRNCFRDSSPGISTPPGSGASCPPP